MNVLKKLADLFSKTEKTAPAKETHISITAVREYDEAQIVKSFGERALFTLSSRPFNAMELAAVFNDFLLEHGISSMVSKSDVKAFNVIDNGYYKGTCLAIKRSYGYVYAFINSVKAYFNDGVKWKFERASFFRVYLPTTADNKVFASCRYTQHTVMATLIYVEYIGPNGIMCEVSPCTCYKLPCPVEKLMDFYH